MMDEYNPDLVLQVIQFLNVVESGRLAVCGKRYYYLVHQYRRLRGPELVTLSSWDRESFHQRPASAIASQYVERLQQKPNLVLAFQNNRSSLEDEIPKHLPPNTTILGACAQNIQVNLQGSVECQSHASVMYASFPKAEIKPFCLEYGPKFKGKLANLQEELRNTQHDDNNYWKAVIVYAGGSGSAIMETFVSSIQSVLPNVAIVGGICGYGYVSQSTSHKSKEDLKKLTVRQLHMLGQQLGGASDVNFVEKSELVDHVYQLQEQTSQQDNELTMADDGVFGVVLGGEAPVRSMVSRGVTSITYGVPQPRSPYVVQEVQLTRPEDPDFVFRGNDLQAIHMIRKIYNRETDSSLTAMEFMAKTTNVAEFIGVKRRNEDGFELHMLSPYCQMVEAYLIMTDGSPAQMESLQDAEIDFFSLSGDACCEDMTRKVGQLKEQTQGEEILGSIMFSCSGRGPKAGGLIRENMADATRFAKEFPDVPCLGFYAGGEVGPLALAGNENVFQTGKAAVQGFTAVFCLFIVPVVEQVDYCLDDCRDSVDRFVASRLKPTTAG